MNNEGRKKMKFIDQQKQHAEELIQNGFFEGDTGNGEFDGKQYPYVLKDGKLNLYKDIREEALKYFNENNVVWWKADEGSEEQLIPTGHILSSQIACLNHLFPIRNNKYAVLNLLKSVSNDLIDVFPIPEDAEGFDGFIQFEAVGGKKNFLNEGNNTRGSNCTSVDALIYAKHRGGRKILIPIEWKYTETYSNKDKSVGSEGDTRKKRYLDLIKESKYLNDNTLSCCWFEPFYQLMRQTLWTEQILKHKPEDFAADDYLHLHIIPNANTELLDKIYPCSNKNMEDTWKDCLKAPNKYVIISPEKLWSKQSKDTDIYTYLKKRYW